MWGMEIYDIGMIAVLVLATAFRRLEGDGLAGGLDRPAWC